MKSANCESSNQAKKTEINALLNNMCVTNRWKIANLTWNIAILK